MLVVLGLIVAFLVILILRPWDRRYCRWREDRSLPGEEVRHTCMSCGAVVMLPRGKTPKDCLAVKK